MRATHRARQIGAALVITAGAGLAAAGLTYGIDHQTSLTPSPRNPDTVSERQVITEDDPEWNCLTMGNRQCGPGYVPLTSEQEDAIAEGVDGDRDWSVCLIHVADTTTVVCPDGTVVTS